MFKIKEVYQLKGTSKCYQITSLTTCIDGDNVYQKIYLERLRGKNDNNIRIDSDVLKNAFQLIVDENGQIIDR